MFAFSLAWPRGLPETRTVFRGNTARPHPQYSPVFSTFKSTHTTELVHSNLIWSHLVNLISGGGVSPSLARCMVTSWRLVSRARASRRTKGARTVAVTHLYIYIYIYIYRERERERNAVWRAASM